VNLHYSGQEIVPAPKAKVWAFISDPASVASCMPDVIETTVVDATHFETKVKIAVGPVRGSFTFKVALDPQPGGDRMNMTISGGGFGSVVDLTAGADIKDNGDGSTTLDWTGDASMRGPVATIGGRVLDAQAQRVISTTFANVKARVGATG
jgi:carbon monoxide dehydrogenase subunit G